MNSSGASDTANNQGQDYDAMDIDIDMDANDNSTVQQSPRPDLAGPAEQISTSQKPRPATVARMLRPLVREIIEDAEEDMFYYGQRLQQLQANRAPAVLFLRLAQAQTPTQSPTQNLAQTLIMTQT